MDCNVCNNRTKALLVFTFQCYIICTFPADGSLYCQSDSVWTNLNDFLGSIKLAIFVVLRHLGILNPLSAPLQDLSLKNIRNHPLSTPLHYPYGLPAPWRALLCTLTSSILVWIDWTPSYTLLWPRPSSVIQLELDLLLCTLPRLTYVTWLDTSLFWTVTSSVLCDPTGTGPPPMYFALWPRLTSCDLTGHQTCVRLNQRAWVTPVPVSALRVS